MKVFLDNGGNKGLADEYLRDQRLHEFGGSASFGTKDKADFPAFVEGLLDGERLAAAADADGGSGTAAFPPVDVSYMHVYNNVLKRFYQTAEGFGKQSREVNL